MWWKIDKVLALNEIIILGEGNVIQVCKIVKNATKVKNSVLRENKRSDLFKRELRKYFLRKWGLVVILNDELGLGNKREKKKGREREVEHYSFPGRGIANLFEARMFWCPKVE